MHWHRTIHYLTVPTVVYLNTTKNERKWLKSTGTCGNKTTGILPTQKYPQCIFCSCLTLSKVLWYWATFSIGLFTTSTTTARLITFTMHSSMAHSWILSSCSPCKLYIAGGCADLEVGESYQQSQHLQVSCNTSVKSMMLICLCIACVRFVCQWDICRHLCEFLFFIIYNA